MIISLWFNSNKAIIDRLPLLVFLFAATLLSSCTKETISNNSNNTYDQATSYSLQNISYGDDAAQRMDIYLPANRSTANTKVFVLIHGGGWSAGDKADYNDFFNGLKTLYPAYAIININYRLATSNSPGYPKQINDIQDALDHIQLAKYQLSNQYFLIGSSAGAHLAMLYGYAFDPDHHVKAICNTVGPADLTDPSFTQNPILMLIINSLLGNITYSQNPSLFAEVSPAKRITASSPKTISFYGQNDPLIPSTQMSLLQTALQANGIYNEATMYAGEGHGDWNQAHSQDAIAKLINFINQYF